MNLSWTIEVERWAYRRPFTIARTRLTHAANLRATVTDGTFVGRGECEPHESDMQIVEHTESHGREFLRDHGSRLDRQRLAALMPCSPLRNAIDCALWDLEAKQNQTSVAALLDIELPPSLPITGTVSLGPAADMVDEAISVSAESSIIKIKLGGLIDEDARRIEAVRAAVSDKIFIVDANEGWSLAGLSQIAPVLAANGVAMIEQPLKRNADFHIADAKVSVSLCADESITDRQSLKRLPKGYDTINIKLDKTGGLTEALALISAARDRGLDYMVGSNGGTSIAAAPAYLLAANARFADIDSPMMLADDIAGGMQFAEGHVFAPTSALWGA
ncbi:MAG: dipeptide epimerase [Pseudomonadota bacterium]